MRRGKKTPKKPEISGTYFVRRQDGLVKIGRSLDIHKRVAGFRTAIPEIELVGWLRADEEELHAIFAAERAAGEWFRPSEDLSAIVAHLAPSLAPGCVEWDATEARAAIEALAERREFVTRDAREKRRKDLARQQAMEQAEWEAGLLASARAGDAKAIELLEANRRRWLTRLSELEREAQKFREVLQRFELRPSVEKSYLPAVSP